MISVQNLGKSFDGRPAVRNITFEAPDRAITGLLGANGAGKTTTLRMICGVLKPESGSIAIDGAAGGDGRDRQHRLGALLDHTGIYSRLTVRENLEYFGELRGIPREPLAERIESALAILALTPIAGRRAGGLSLGEHVKTALVRALLHSPQNLLLDEPTNGLDVPSVRALRDLLRRLRDAGVCIVFSSHVLAEVRALCDNVVILAGGTVIAQGSPSEICARTDSPTLEDAFVELTSQTEKIPC